MQFCALDLPQQSREGEFQTRNDFTSPVCKALLVIQLRFGEGKCFSGKSLPKKSGF